MSFTYLFSERSLQVLIERSEQLCMFFQRHSYSFEFELPFIKRLKVAIWPLRTRQLFINLSNEILQSHFNQHFFRMELQARALHVATLSDWMDILHLPDPATRRSMKPRASQWGLMSNTRRAIVETNFFWYGCRSKGPCLVCSMRWPFVCQNDLWRKLKVEFAKVNYFLAKVSRK